MEPKNKSQREPGFACPNCGAVIMTSIEELLTCRSLRCSACHLELKLDRWESRQALNALEKIKEARQRVEKTSKFNR